MERCNVEDSVTSPLRVENTAVTSTVRGVLGLCTRLMPFTPSEPTTNRHQLNAASCRRPADASKTKIYLRGGPPRRCLAERLFQTRQ